MRFLLVDAIVLWKPGACAEAVKNVSLSEDFFDDHFPLKPIMPGVLLIEGLAQLSGLLLEESVKQLYGLHRKALMSVVEKTKFRTPVYPGDQLHYAVSVEQLNELGGRVAGTASVNGTLAAEGSLLFSFHSYDNPVQDAVRRNILQTWLRNAV